MNLTLRFKVTAPDDTDHERLVDEVASGLEERGLTVVSKGQSSNDLPFTVLGVVKGKPSERWQEDVMAQDEDEAESKAHELAPDGQQRTVAAVLPGPPTAA